MVSIIKRSAMFVNWVGPEVVSDRWQRQRDMAHGATPVPLLEPESEGATVFRVLRNVEAPRIF